MSFFRHPIRPCNFRERRPRLSRQIRPCHDENRLSSFGQLLGVLGMQEDQAGGRCFGQCTASEGERPFYGFVLVVFFAIV